jgi:hypothetical protein
MTLMTLMALAIASDPPTGVEYNSTEGAETMWRLTQAGGADETHLEVG